MTTITPALPGIGEPTPKAFRGGTHRVIPPEQTLTRLRPLLPVMGITRVANVTGLDSIGVPVVMVCRPNSRSLAVAQGKGLDLAAAKASGLMESIEGYHAERITLPLKLGSYEELRYTHRLIDVTALPRTAGSRFHPHLPLLWIQGHDLLQDEPVWVPYETVHLNYTLPSPSGSGCFAATSNGLASGNHPLEAVSHAICEVVERDATALLNLRTEEQLPEARLDLDTVDDPGCCVVLEKCARANVVVAVWEMTTDIGMPAFHCLIVDRDEDPLRRLYASSGMGCHPTRQIALLRALTEAVQSRLTLISGSRDDTLRDAYESLRGPDMLHLNRALMEVKAPMRHFHDAPSWDGETFDDDVNWELDRLRSVGIERAVVVDLTKPELRVPVVRVVIPGLEGVDKSPGYVHGARARAFLEART